MERRTAGGHHAKGGGAALQVGLCGRGLGHDGRPDWRRRFVNELVTVAIHPGTRAERAAGLGEGDGWHCLPGGERHLANIAPGVGIGRLEDRGGGRQSGAPALSYARHQIRRTTGSAMRHVNLVGATRDGQSGPQRDRRGSTAAGGILNLRGCGKARGSALAG